MQFPLGTFNQMYRGFRISYIGDSMRNEGCIEPLTPEAVQATALACWMTPIEWMPNDGEDLDSFKKRTAAAVDSLLSDAASVQETPIEYRGISVATRVNRGRDASWGRTATLLTERDKQVFWGIAGTKKPHVQRPNCAGGGA